MAKLQLSVALAVSEQRNNLTRLILEGVVSPDGIDLLPSDVYSGSRSGPSGDDRPFRATGQLK